jgi:AcrR family transcriptional regulator
MVGQHESIQPSGTENPVRERIVAAARHRFFAQGFRGVTMDDLAEELAMSKKTLYAHFATKALLVEAVLEAKFQEAETALKRITADSSGDFFAALHEMLAYMQHQTEEIQPPFLRDVQREAPELFSLIDRRRRDLVQRYFGKLLTEGRRAGIIRKDIPAKLVIEILLGAAQAIVKQLSELDITPRVAYSSIITVILEGVITQEGRERL